MGIEMDKGVTPKKDKPKSDRARRMQKQLFALHDNFFENY